MKTTNAIGLDVEKSKELALKLNDLLSNLQVFYTNTRGYHWNIKGPKFFELHVKFEELYNDLIIKIDEVAEPFAVPYSAPPGWEFGDPAPPICRWRDLQLAVNTFLSIVNSSALNEFVSLSSYSHVATTEVSLTTNYAAISAALQPYTDSFQAGATNIGGGINEGIGALFSSPLARPYAAKVIVVMTDGIHNAGTYPIGPAEAAAINGVLIFAITFSNEADQYLMQQVAARGGGRHFHANSAADLVNAFQEIARALPNLLTH